MINVLICDCKILLIDSSITKVKLKLKELKNRNAYIKSISKNEFENGFNSSRKLLREYLEKCFALSNMKDKVIDINTLGTLEGLTGNYLFRKRGGLFFIVQNGIEREVQDNIALMKLDKIFKN